MKHLSGLGISLGLMFLMVVISRPAFGGTPLCGGWSEASITNGWVVSAANFAVKAKGQAMAKEKPAKIVTFSLVEIMSVRQQVVAGMNYDLRLKVRVDGSVKEAEAVVWRKLDGEHLLTSWVWELGSK